MPKTPQGWQDLETLGSRCHPGVPIIQSCRIWLQPSPTPQKGPLPGAEPTSARAPNPHRGLGHKLKFNFIKRAAINPGLRLTMPGGRPLPGGNSPGLPRSPLQTAGAAFSAQIYGAGSVWGLSYSSSFDRGLHYSASNPPTLRAGGGPCSRALGIVLWGPAPPPSQAEACNPGAQPTLAPTPAGRSPWNPVEEGVLEAHFTGQQTEAQAC